MNPTQENNTLLKEDEIASSGNIEHGIEPTATETAISAIPTATAVSATPIAPITAAEPTTEPVTAEATSHINNDNITSPPKSPSFKPAEMFNATTKGLKGISTKLNPVKKQLDKGFYQVRQIAQETFGTADELTAIPQEYRDLEKRVDTLRQLYSNLLKVTKTYGTPHYDYPVPIQESVVGFTTNVVNRIRKLSAASDPIQDETTRNIQLEKVSEHPKTLAHAVGQVAADGAKDIGTGESLGTALDKYAAASDELGDARVEMDREIVERFNKPIKSTLNVSMEEVQKARRKVEVTRFSLDALKTKFKELKSGDVTGARQEVEKAEEEFIGAIEESTRLMRGLLDNPEPLGDLVDMAQAQLSYFKKAEELFSQLVPELTELRVTQESMYRSNDDE
ncbi:hypothetical protein K501DRAFT_309733 [Backusella circina FSU 941]|nr:hypothetical protein K501DRAFT_309733 [Backusella circina FSU 941]